MMASSATATPKSQKQQLPGHLQTQPSDNDRSSSELRALDCNLASLCDHIQMEGFNSGAFSDVIVQAMGSTYLLHRLILSRSSYFRLFPFLSFHGGFCGRDEVLVLASFSSSGLHLIFFFFWFRFYHICPDSICFISIFHFPVCLRSVLYYILPDILFLQFPDSLISSISLSFPYPNPAR